MKQLGLCYESLARKPGWRFTGRRKLPIKLAVIFYSFFSGFLWYLISKREFGWNWFQISPFKHINRQFKRKTDLNHKRTDDKVHRTILASWWNLGWTFEIFKNFKIVWKIKVGRFNYIKSEKIVDIWHKIWHKLNFRRKLRHTQRKRDEQSSKRRRQQAKESRVVKTKSDWLNRGHGRRRRE